MALPSSVQLFENKIFAKESLVTHSVPRVFFFSGVPSLFLRTPVSNLFLLLS